MELSNLLSAMVQSAEVDTLGQIQRGPNSAPASNAFAQVGATLSGQGQTTSAAGQVAASVAAVLGGTEQQGGAPQPVGGSATAPVLTATNQPVTNAAAAAAGNVAVPAQPNQPNLPVLIRGGGNDTYHGTAEPASPSLLQQNGVGAYIQLLNAFSTHESNDKTANLVPNNLGTASASLKAAYNQAVAGLPQDLQQKDWGFSVADGALVFTAGKDSLSTQDMANLQKAFANANVAFSAREVAAAIVTIDARRQEGADSGSLAWGGIGADDKNFGDVVNLRAYVSTTAPGSNYQPNMPAAAHNMPPEIPYLLGGMDLRDLVSARPNFFRKNGSVETEEEIQEVNEDATFEAEDLGALLGQCSCGQVRFNVENTFEYAFYCHCSRCRIRTGSAFAAIAGIGVDKVQVTAGNDQLLIEGECSDGYGARCGHCHAFLFAVVRERKYMHVALGVLEGTPSRLPDHHIYVGSKAPWFQISDDLPQYDELPK
jgi:hypothetical protein